MTAKEYLSQVKKIDLSIRHLKMERAELMEALSGVGGVDYSRDRVQTGTVSDAQFVSCIDQLLRIENDIADKISLLAEKKHDIIRQINTMDNPIYADILFRRYIDYKKYKNLEAVAESMGYTFEYIRQLHGKALLAFAKTNKIL